MSTPLRERPDAPLGTLIFRAGLLPAETIENALEEGVKTGRRLGEILVERNLIKEEDLTRLLAGQKGLPYVSLRERPVEVEAARLLAEDQARLFTALPIGFEEGIPVVAVADPTNDVLNRNIREAIGQDARFVVVARSELNEVIGEIFNGTRTAAAEAPEDSAHDTEPAPFDARVPAPQPEAAVVPEPEPEVAPEPQPEVAPEREPEAAVAPEPEPEAPVMPSPEPVAAVAPEPEPEAPVMPSPEPVAAVVPDPELEAAPEPELSPEPEPVAEPQPLYETPEPEPALRVETGPVYEPEPAPQPAFEAPAPVASAPPKPSFEAPEPEPEPEPVLEMPAPVAERDPEPEPTPVAAEPVSLATEPVAPQTVPQSNGRVPETFEDDTPPPAEPVAAAGYRVSIRLTSGEKLTVADCEDLGEAKGYAKALTKQLGATEAGDWPFVNGRFLKPDTIVSVDIEEL
jgi:MshEN domain